MVVVDFDFAVVEFVETLKTTTVLAKIVLQHFRSPSFPHWTRATTTTTNTSCYWYCSAQKKPCCLSFFFYSILSVFKFFPSIYVIQQFQFQFPFLSCCILIITFRVCVDFVNFIVVVAGGTIANQFLFVGTNSEQIFYRNRFLPKIGDYWDRHKLTPMVTPSLVVVLQQLRYLCFFGCLYCWYFLLDLRPYGLFLFFLLVQAQKTRKSNLK